MTIPHDSKMPSIQILLIDDHKIFLAGLRSLLQNESGMNVMGEARNRSEALEAAGRQPDIILLDLDLGAETGEDLLPELLKVAENARVMLLTGITDSDLHLRAVCLGAMGIVHKLEAPEILVKAIRKVFDGEVWLNRAIVATAMTRLQAPRRKADPTVAKIASLTTRELDVIAALGEGRRNKEIGERLFISEKTVSHYLTAIFSKLEVADRLELMIFSYQHGLAEVPARP